MLIRPVLTDVAMVLKKIPFLFAHQALAFAGVSPEYGKAQSVHRASSEASFERALQHHRLEPGRGEVFTIERLWNPGEAHEI